MPKASLAASLSTEARRLLEEKNIEFSESLTSNPFHHKMGDFAELGLGNSYWPSDLFASLLEWIHVHNQLPWWAAITLTAVVFRVTLLPFALRVARNMSILPHIQPRLKPLMANLKKARQSKNLATMQHAENKVLTVYRDNGYSPYLNIIMLIQLPLFISAFRALWKAAHIPVPGFQTGGTLWFTDLTLPDPYFILPTISGLTTAWTVMVHLFPCVHTLFC
jgi:YidC/Oxa1 family membrane protein insertase